MTREEGSDDQLRRLGAWDNVQARLASDLHAGEYEEALVSNEPEADDEPGTGHPDPDESPPASEPHPEFDPLPGP